MSDLVATYRWTQETIGLCEGCWNTLLVRRTRFIDESRAPGAQDMGDGVYCVGCVSDMLIGKTQPKLWPGRIDFRKKGVGRRRTTIPKPYNKGKK